MRRVALMGALVAVAASGCNVPGIFGKAASESRLSRSVGVSAAGTPTTAPTKGESTVTGVIQLLKVPDESTVDVELEGGRLTAYKPAVEGGKVAWKLKLDRGVKDVVIAKLRFALLIGDADPANAYRLSQFMPPPGAPGALPPEGSPSSSPSGGATADPNAPGSTSGASPGTDGTSGPPVGGAMGPGGAGIGAPAGVSGAPGGAAPPVGGGTGTTDGSTSGGMAGPPGIGAGTAPGAVAGGVPGFAMPPSLDPSARPSGEPANGLSGLPGGTAVGGGIAMPGGIAGPTIVGNGISQPGLPTAAPSPTATPPVLGADGKPVAAPGNPGDFQATLVPVDLGWPGKLAPNEEVEVALPLDGGHIKRFVEQNVAKSDFARTGKFIFRVRIKLVTDTGYVLQDANQQPVELRATVVVE